MGAIHGPFSIDASAVEGYAVQLSNAANLSPSKMRAKVHHWTALLLTQIKRNASLPAGGPPGPRLITGDYNRSITRDYEEGVHTSVGIVGTNAVQARRLEYGFFGTDSLGRNYHQPAYAHFRPAADDIEPKFLADLEATFGAELGGPA